MHDIIVICCGIIHSINVRTVTAKLALETPQGHQDKGKHTIFGLGHFQILLKPGSCTWLYAQKIFRKAVWGKEVEQKDWELAFRVGWQKWGNSNSFLNHCKVCSGPGTDCCMKWGNCNWFLLFPQASRLSRSCSEKVLIEGSNYLVIKWCCCIW